MTTLLADPDERRHVESLASDKRGRFWAVVGIIVTLILGGAALTPDSFGSKILYHLFGPDGSDTPLTQPAQPTSPSAPTSVPTTTQVATPLPMQLVAGDCLQIFLKPTKLDQRRSITGSYYSLLRLSCQDARLTAVVVSSSKPGSKCPRSSDRMTDTARR